MSYRGVFMFRHANFRTIRNIFLNTDDFWRDYEHMKSIGINFVRDPQEQDYGTVAVFEDLYGNLWDLLQLNPDHPMAKR